VTRALEGEAEFVGSEILAACEILDTLGLTGAFGHVSARLAEPHLVMTPRESPVFVEELTQLVVYDPAAPADEDLAVLPPERHIHEQIYRARPDVMAICRFHGPFCLAASTALDEIRTSVGYGAFLGPAVPVRQDPRLVRSAELGQAVASDLGSCSAILIRGNGAAAVGSNVRAATVRAAWLEITATALIRAAALGVPRVLSGEEVQSFSPAVANVQIERAWRYYAGRYAPKPK
jgi:ribulose-5-phosphate 4-epimerase/fuculose-1-phosphate aldolase